MADLTNLILPVDPATVLLMGTGGESRERAQYVDGKRQETPMTWENGATLRRLSGIAVSVAGQGLDGATVETITPLETVPAGAIFKAEGRCELRVRADARPGFNGGAPRGVIVSTLFVERLTPVGAASDVLAAATPARQRGEKQ